MASSQNQAIVATGLTKWFGEGNAKMTAVNAVGLVAYFGEMLFIVGPSGSGKTTMLSMISGILRPNAGRVTVKGADIWSFSNDQLRPTGEPNWRAIATPDESVPSHSRVG